MASIIWIYGNPVKNRQMPLRDAIIESEVAIKNGYQKQTTNDYLFRHGDEFYIAKGNIIEGMEAKS